MLTINELDFKGKKALIRVDFNVPLDEKFNVTDNTRIKAAKPTIDKILKDGGAVILMSHLGRPEGVEKKYSLSHIVDAVAEILCVSVKFASDCIGSEAETVASNLKMGEVLLLENLRFHPEEKKGDIEFAQKLAALGDVYVNDAFGTAHRAHASTTTIAQFFPNKKCFGSLLANEIISIDRFFNEGKKPVLAILGGAKVSSKITIIENMLDRIDRLIIGGGMIFTFSKAMGGNIGKSICENDKLDLALAILKKAKEKNVEVFLPTDILAADEFSNEANTETHDIQNIPEQWIGVDVGPETIKQFSNVILESQTILWNGPMGVFEIPAFAKGTIAVGTAIAKATSSGSFSLVGGGDSVAAAKQFGFDTKVSYVSTGGGAMLESLEGKTLPGIQAMLS